MIFKRTKTRKLRGLSLDRVDMVPAGAHPGAHISLFKSERVDDDPYAISRRENRDEEPSVSKTAEELQAEIEKAQAAQEEAETKLAEAEKKLSETSEAELTKAREEIEKLQSELEKSESADVQKALDETREELNKLREAERTRVFKEKAEEIGIGNPEKLGKVLAEADEKLSEEAQATLGQVLKAAAAQEETSILFKQLSDPDAEVEGWEERLEKAAAERVSKSDGKLTIEQAKVQIMQENRELREDYQKARS